MKLDSKQSLREHFIKLRGNLTPHSVSQKSKDICQKLLNLAEIKRKKTFSCYLPINSEVETKLIIDILKRRKTKNFLPTYIDKKNEYFFCEFTSWQNLKKGPFDILQPTKTKITDLSLINVAIIPGLAFSKSGVRLGYGKGVFDKLLAKSNALIIALAYDFQIIDKIPREKHDLTVDIIISEKRVIKI